MRSGNDAKNAASLLFPVTKNAWIICSCENYSSSLMIFVFRLFLLLLLVVVVVDIFYWYFFIFCIDKENGVSRYRK